MTLGCFCSKSTAKTRSFVAIIPLSLAMTTGVRERILWCSLVVIASHEAWRAGVGHVGLERHRGPGPNHARLALLFPVFYLVEIRRRQLLQPQTRAGSRTGIARECMMRLRHLHDCLLAVPGAARNSSVLRTKWQRPGIRQ
jgi:hypothetical protein